MNKLRGKLLDTAVYYREKSKVGMFVNSLDVEQLEYLSYLLGADVGRLGSNYNDFLRSRIKYELFELIYGVPDLELVKEPEPKESVFEITKKSTEHVHPKYFLDTTFDTCKSQGITLAILRMPRDYYDKIVKEIGLTVESSDYPPVFCKEGIKFKVNFTD